MADRETSSSEIKARQIETDLIHAGEASPRSIGAISRSGMISFETGAGAVSRSSVGREATEGRSEVFDQALAI